MFCCMPFHLILPPPRCRTCSKHNFQPIQWKSTDILPHVEYHNSYSRMHHTSDKTVRSKFAPLHNSKQQQYKTCRSDSIRHRHILHIQYRPRVFESWDWTLWKGSLQHYFLWTHKIKNLPWARDTKLTFQMCSFVKTNKHDVPFVIQRSTVLAGFLAFPIEVTP